MSELPPIKVYTVKELAKIFNKDPETIRRWIKSGYLPAVKMGGSYVVEDETLRAILRGKNHRRKELGSLIFPIKSSYSPSEMLSDTLVAVDSTGKGWEQVQAVCDNDAILEADETGTQWTEIRLVCYIFYLYVIEDLTMRAIGQKLMEEGKHPSSAEAWSISVLSRMLEDEAYIGNAYQYMSQIVQEPGQKPRQVARPLKEQIKLPDGVIPKVIRREIFEAAQRKSQENKQYAERNNPNVENGILRCGFIRCGYCNGSMTVKRRDTVKSEQGRIARYVCQSGSSVISNCKAPTISTQVLDTIVWEKVTERTKLLAKMPHLIDEAIERHLQRDPKKVELPSVTNQIAKLNRTIRSLVSMANQDIDEDIQEEINSQLVYYSQQKIKLLELKDQIEEQHVAWEKIADVLREFKAWCLESAGDIEHASYKQKRIALNALGVRVKVWSVDHEPRYYIEMSPPTILKAVSPTAATLSERKSLKKGSTVFQSSRVGGSLD